MIKTCTKCKQNKDKSEFKYRAKNRLHSWCRECMDRLSLSRHTAVRHKTKMEAVQYKGGRCSKCGGVFHPAVFDFHHEGDKNKIIGRYLHYGIDKIKDELDKCILVCSNCHRLIHWEMSNYEDTDD